MKRIAILGISMVSYCLTFGQTGNGDTWEQVKASGSGAIRILQFEQPKFAAINDNNQFEGFCVDLLDDFVKYLKEEKQVDLTYDVDRSITDFAKAYQNIKGGSDGTFGVGAVAINEERKKEITFTEPYLTLGLVLVSSPKASTITSVSDVSTAFKGYVAYAEKGTVSEAEILKIKRDYLPDLTINYVKSHQVLGLVASNDKAFAYAGISDLLGSMQKGLKLHKAGNVKGTDVGFILPPNSDWKSVFDEFFLANGGYKNSQSFKSSLRKHFGESGYKLISSMQ